MKIEEIQRNKATITLNGDELRALHKTLVAAPNKPDFAKNDDGLKHGYKSLRRGIAKAWDDYYKYTKK